MREDDRHIRKIDGDVVHKHRIGILQTDAGAARHARADPSLTGVKQSWEPGFRNRLVENVGAAVVRIKTLHRGMKLETTHTKLANKPPGFPRPGFSFGRIDAGKWNENVAVG